MAERVGFEPTMTETAIPDFESGAFDHSATSPREAQLYPQAPLNRSRKTEGLANACG